MADIRLDASVARAIARILQMDEVYLPMLKAVHGVLADILLTAPDADEAPADGEIRRAMRARLDDEGEMSNALINFGVKDGVVEIRGVIGSEQDRQRLLGIAKTAYGVDAVHDHLVWVDPATHAFMPSVEDSCPG
jgi:osmotically-inducible protein OsmY